MKIIIKSAVGLSTPVDLEVDPHEKIRTVKERAATAQVVEASNVKISHNNEVLDENKTLKEYGIKEGDTLELLPNHMRGASSPLFSFEDLQKAYTQLSGKSSSFERRISEEAKLIRAQGLPIIPKNPKHWIMTIKAKKGKWKGKKYVVHVYLTDGYPFVPPQVKWKTPMKPSHPHIFPRTGWVCLNILDKDWKSNYSLITIYNALIWLLENPFAKGTDKPKDSHGFLWRRY